MWTTLLITAMGACLGYFGGLLGRTASDRWGTSSTGTRRDLISGLRRRSLLIGGVASGALVVMSYFNSAEPVGRQFGIVCLGASFVLATLYVVPWLILVTEFGTRPVEACELSLLASMVLVSLLYICGVLWYTLMAIGGCVLIAAIMFGGLYVYRFP